MLLRLLPALLLCSVACATVRSPAPAACDGNSCQVLQALPSYEPKELKLEGPISTLESLDFIVELAKAVEDKEAAIHVTIDSPGGSVNTMFGIIDLMREGQANGMKVRCTVRGMAASAAFIILEAGCQDRAMTRGSQLMVHEPATSAQGKEGDFRRIADDLADTNRRVATLIAHRLLNLDGTRMTADQYEAWIKDRNRWVDWAEALQRGAVDRVVY